MAPHDDYQVRALDCLQQMERAKSKADRRAWKMLAGSFLLLRKFQQSAERRRQAVKSEVMALQD
jgi:vacuolar-type H+-ATPase subunit E/Vma4